MCALKIYETNQIIKTEIHTTKQNFKLSNFITIYILIYIFINELLFFVNLRKFDLSIENKR